MGAFQFHLQKLEESPKLIKCPHKSNVVLLERLKKPRFHEAQPS